MVRARATLDRSPGWGPGLGLGRVVAVVVPVLLASLALVASIALALAWPLEALARESTQEPVQKAAQKESPESENRVVRVGWYDSTFNTMDSSGRRSGYAYEYQLKVAAYTGWSYEYVSGSWSELLQMLIDGRIDLMSDVSYTEERAKTMLFPDYAMGAEEYYLFVAPGNTEISSTDPSTLNGKRVGVNKDSIQADFYRAWAEKNGVDAEPIELTSSEDDSLKMVADGKLDAYVTVDFFTEPGKAVPMYKAGSSDFFFAVSKKRPELLPELNSALGRIREENHNINQELFDRFVLRAGANAFLTTDELSWLADHGPIRVGYQDDYLAFCAADKEGNLVGALRDYLNIACDCLQNAHLDFEPCAYPTSEAAYAALAAGEVDCVFPSSLDGYDGERQGVIMTLPLMSTEIDAVVRQADVNTFANREHVVVAVNQGNPNYESVLAVSFPTWRTVYFENTDECLKAVADSVADCVLISSFRYNNISRTCERLHLTTFPTSVGLDSCLAVESGNSELYAILEKVVSQVPASKVNTALSHYITEDAKRTLADYLADNMVLVLTGALAVVLVVVFFMVRSMRAERRSRELIEATETDALTGLLNRDYFLQYATTMRHEQPDVLADAIVVNIDSFHSINALSGRDFGDQVLKVLGNEIHQVATEREGLAGRFGADRFDVFCKHTDDDYQALYDRLQGKLVSVAPNASIRLRMGVLPASTGLEPIQMFDMARTACSMARGNSIEHLIVFNESVRARELFEQRLSNDLRRALDNYEFEIYYQPKFDIQQEPPRLVSAEALIRWNHPELGMISPADFIPLFERSGAIREVDKFAWAQAARQVACWRAEFGVTLPVSVNLSRVDVFDPELEVTLDGILLMNGLEHDTLKLEVTESAYTENADQLIQVVENLRAKGYTVEMDDFGTGYSSLNMLSAIPIDVLKIDRAFIATIDCDERTERLVELILGIAKSLDVSVVAEGVETESQLELLKRLGCQLIQGYYFSRPLHPTDFEDRYFRGEGR